LAAITKDNGLSSVAYTYNEPTLQGEYITAAAPVLSDSGIASVIVTNGIFSSSLCADFSRVISAANVDVKTFNAETYRRIGGCLDTVMSNVESLLRGGVHIELTNLVVPGISDSIEDFVRMVDWIAGMDRRIPLHISRYFPAFRYSAPPTDVRVMEKFCSYAITKLSRVHLGNVR
jgi:pyruvate formate lyase activating enzyme